LRRTVVSDSAVKLSARQAHYLLGVLRDSLGLEWNGFGLSQELRQGLYNEITNQQSTVVKELE
jgi:hypothetical protein